MFEKCFSPLKIGPLELKNRIIMAPLTRQTAYSDGTPTSEMAGYYSRRAQGGVGLIITEGTYEEDKYGCKAYLSQPGISNKDQVEAWKKTTGESFDSLTTEQATVVASVAFQYGNLETETPNFWKYVTSNQWQKAYNELMDFEDNYSTRRKEEAKLLFEYLKKNKK